MKQHFNIVVPMAGRGSRFTEQGYTDSKPFIDVNGKPMIQRVIENLNIEFDSNYEFTLICLQEDFLPMNLYHLLYFHFQITIHKI